MRDKLAFSCNRWQRLAFMVTQLERLLAAHARLDAYADPRGPACEADGPTVMTRRNFERGLERLEQRIEREMDWVTAALLRADLARRKRKDRETPKGLAARDRMRRNLTRKANERDAGGRHETAA